MISFEPSDDEKEILKTVERFAEAEVRTTMRDVEAAGRAPEELRRKYHEMGLGMLNYPETVGGSGMGQVTRALIEEALAFGDPGAAIGLDGPGLAGLAILELGEGAHDERYLAPFAATDAHQRTAALALLEPKPVADWCSLATHARETAAGYLLDGAKSFVVNGADADFYVVFASFDPARGWDGLAAFVVEKGTPGVTVTEPILTCGLNGVPIVDLTLDGVVVPKAARLSGRGDFAGGFRRFLARARVVNAARIVGLSRAACEYAIHYAEERTAFGKPIGHHQGLSWMIADIATEVDAARWLVWKAAWEIDRGIASAERSSIQALVQANEMAKKVTNDGVQVLGGAGFIRDYPVEKWYRDARTLAFVLGTDPMDNSRAATLTFTNDGESPLDSLSCV